MSVYGSAMSEVLPWQPGENVCTTAYFAFIAPFAELALHSSRTSAAHEPWRTMGSGQSIHGVSPRSVTQVPRRYVAISGECFGGARPSEYFSHFPEWDSPIQKLRAKLKI